MTYPRAYQLPSRNARFQQMIEWPADTPGKAILNERVRDLIHALPGLNYRSISAKVGLEKIQALSVSERLKMVEKAAMDLGPKNPDHPANWLYYCQTSDGDAIYGPLNVLAECCPHIEPMHWWTDERRSDKVKSLTKIIQDSLDEIRSISENPIGLTLSKDVELIIPPKCVGSVTIARHNWGQTNINYTHEGLILDVYAEDATESLHTTSIYSEDLENYSDVAESEIN